VLRFSGAYAIDEVLISLSRPRSLQAVGG